MEKLTKVQLPERRTDDEAHLFFHHPTRSKCIHNGSVRNGVFSIANIERIDEPIDLKMEKREMQYATNNAKSRKKQK